MTTNRYDWWAMPQDQKHTMLTTYVKAIQQDQSSRRLQWLQFSRMYQNQAPDQYYTSLGAASSAYGARMGQWSSRNIVKSCIDTATSKIGKSKPRPVFLTEDGNYKQKQKAKKLTQFVDGQFDQMKIYSKAASVFRDGGIFGIGALKFSVNTDLGTVECERVLIDEILVDDADAVYGNPQQIHHVKYASRSALKAKFPKQAKTIDAVQSPFQAGNIRTHNADLIQVYESYRLPSKPGAKDGRKVLALETCTLDDVEWNKTYFPYVFHRWCDRVSGFWGLGIAEELYGTQSEINKILRNIDRALTLVAVPRVYVQPGSMPTAKMDNQIGAVITSATTPVFNTPTAMNSETYNHLKWLVQSGFDQIGISEMSATGQKPAGLDSGIAIREYEDVTSERFMVVGQKWEEFFLDAAKITIDLNKDLMGMDIKVTTKIQDKDWLKTLDWKDIDLAEDKYILRCFSANILPTTPAGRLAKVQELMQAGLIPIEEGLKLLDFPDFKAYRNKLLASSDLAEKMIDSCLEGRYIAPEPQMNLQQALSLAQECYLEAKLNDAPSKGLSMLNRWMEAIKGMLPAAPVAVSPMAPIEPTPGTQATPEAAPTNPLIPFNGQG